MLDGGFVLHYISNIQSFRRAEHLHSHSQINLHALVHSVKLPPPPFTFMIIMANFNLENIQHRNRLQSWKMLDVTSVFSFFRKT